MFFLRHIPSLIFLRGGGAITHCALLSGKWDHIVANDKTDSVSVFMAAIKGEFANYATVPTREEFLASNDTALRMLYSFGNDKTTYLWSPELESVKVPACKMISAPSMHERRLAYMEFCKALTRWIQNKGATDSKTLYPHGPSELESMERLQALERVEALERDYRLIEIPEGATVYADPPYRATINSSRYGAFDFEAFDLWLAGVDFPVYVSEYDAPAGCVEIASTERLTTMAANGAQKRVERIFVQERFADDCKPLMFDWG